MLSYARISECRGFILSTTIIFLLIAFYQLLRPAVDPNPLLPIINRFLAQHLLLPTNGFLKISFANKLLDRILFTNKHNKFGSNLSLKYILILSEKGDLKTFQTFFGSLFYGYLYVKVIINNNVVKRDWDCYND